MDAKEWFASLIRSNEPTLEETLTIPPCRERRNSGSMASVTVIAPKTLVSNTARTTATSTLPTTWAWRSPAMPALFTSTFEAAVALLDPAGGIVHCGNIGDVKAQEFDRVREGTRPG